MVRPMLGMEGYICVVGLCFLGRGPVLLGLVMVNDESVTGSWKGWGGRGSRLRGNDVLMAKSCVGLWAAGVAGSIIGLSSSLGCLHNSARDGHR